MDPQALQFDPLGQFAEKGVIQKIHRHRLKLGRFRAGLFGVFERTHHCEADEVTGRDKPGQRLRRRFCVAHQPLEGGAQGVELMLVHFLVQRISVKHVLLLVEQERTLIAEVVIEREPQIFVQPVAIIVFYSRADFLVRLDQAHRALHERCMITQSRKDTLPLERVGVVIVTGGRKRQDRAKARYNDQHRRDGRDREAARRSTRPSRNISLQTEGHEKAARSTQCRR